MDNPYPAKLNSLVKLHKANKPIRLLINSKTEPNYELSRAIAHLLKHKLQLENKHNIINSIHLTQQLSEIEVNKQNKLLLF